MASPIGKILRLEISTMLVGFIGSPCSGKTTVAAKLFAELKDMGLPADYIAEQARFYIAKKRRSLKKEGQVGPMVLSDHDQMEIARSQFMAELVMNEPDTITVSDSSVLNAMLYMSEEVLGYDEVRVLMERAAAKYDILFVCAPIQRPTGIDPNRVHDEVASAAAHEKIEPLLMPLLKDKTVILLGGNSRQRLADAISAVLNGFNSR